MERMEARLFLDREEGGAPCGLQGLPLPYKHFGCGTESHGLVEDWVVSGDGWTR